MAGDENPYAEFATPATNPYAQFAESKKDEPSSTLDFFRSIPGGIVGGLSNALSASGQAAQIEMGQTPDVPSGAESREILEHNITGPLPKPETRAGRFGETVGEFLGSPASYVGPGSLLTKAGMATLGALGSEAGGQLFEGSRLEGPARLAGAVAVPVSTMGGVRAVRNALQPETNVAADLGRALARDQTTPEQLLSRAEELNTVRPGVATIADAGGENVRGLLERVAQTPGAGRSIVNPALQARQQQQMGRMATDLAQLTGSRRTALQATQQTMAERAEAAAPLYQQAYQDGDRAIWSPELERLSSSPTVRGAMQGAVRVWRDNVIADGYGAMNPGANVQNGILRFEGTGVPAFPNLQFWDYTKRIIDDKVAAAVRAGQNQKARTLTTLARSLRTELDQAVPSYAEARNAWAGPSQYLDAVEDGGQILSRNLSGEQLAANLAEMTEAQREGYTVGAITAIRRKMGSDPAKMADMTKYLRSPEMREKIGALMPTPEAREAWERRLNFEVGSSELTGRALGNSATYRRMAERQDADNIVADLVFGAVSGHGTGRLLRNLLMAGPQRIRDTLRSRSDALLGTLLATPADASGPQLRNALNRATDTRRIPYSQPIAAGAANAITDRRTAPGFASGGRVEDKKTKASVHYRDGSRNKRCGLCTMFRSPHLCTAVQGMISPGKLCDLFEPKQDTHVQTPKIDRRWDVPYLAGSNNDNNVVYIDRRVPKRIAVKRADGKGRVWIDPAEPLAQHELHEHAAMNKGKSYERAHLEDADSAERAWIKAHGLSWDDYEKIMDGLLSHIEHEHTRKAPSQLYLKPYPHNKQVILKKDAARA